MINLSKWDWGYLIGVVVGGLFEYLVPAKSFTSWFVGMTITVTLFILLASFSNNRR